MNKYCTPKRLASINIVPLFYFVDDNENINEKHSVFDDTRDRLYNVIIVTPILKVDKRKNAYAPVGPYCVTVIFYSNKNVKKSRQEKRRENAFLFEHFLTWRLFKSLPDKTSHGEELHRDFAAT